MSYDKSVWTSEKPDPREWYWFDEDSADGGAPFLDCRDRMPSKDYVRSIHPIPSAEEIAALVECEKAAKGLQVRLDAHFGGPKHSIDWLEQERLRAALARLDAARKERVA